ncbi:MAG: helix-turn-helix transcriptional regulator [Gemmataceae bacterium]|nr:helix-turn-helix transcriptional regulator [Gemmataceae bacterium]
MAKKRTEKQIKSIRERFQREQPTPEQLIASGEIEPPVIRAAYLAARHAAIQFRKWRDEAGWSLSRLASRAGVDKATLSRLEAGTHVNPTLDVLARCALALGRDLTLSFPPLAVEPERPAARPERKAL